MMNTYYVSIPAFVILALIAGNRNTKKGWMAVLSVVTGFVTAFSIVVESFAGIVQLLDKYNGFDVNPVYSVFGAMFFAIIAGAIVAGVCYVLATRNSKNRKRVAKKSRADYGDLNEIAYGSSITVQELVPVLCQ